MPKLKLENPGVVPWADEEPKIEVDVPKAEVLEEPKGEGEMLGPNVGVELNRDGVDAGVEL